AKALPLIDPFWPEDGNGVINLPPKFGEEGASLRGPSLRCRPVVAGRPLAGAEGLSEMGLEPETAGRAPCSDRAPETDGWVTVGAGSRRASLREATAAVVATGSRGRT